MPLKAVSLFTGVGGLDFGFEAAGFHTAVAVEIDPVACRTLRLNRPKWSVIERDIHAVSGDDLRAASRLGPDESPDVLIGGPPCQPFSKSGYWKSGDAKRLDDPRSDTLVAYLRVLRDLRPRAFLLENVAGLAFKGKDEGLRFLESGIEEVNKQAGTNYKVYRAQLNAARFGVPQLRERVFLIGSRDGDRFDFPLPTHAEIAGVDIHGRRLERFRTAWDAVGDLPQEVDDPALRVRGAWADLLPSIPEGQNYLWHTPRNVAAGKPMALPLFGWRTRYWSFLLKLAKNSPSWTIQAQPGPAIGPFHWKNRLLSAQELCRIQTFPEGLKFDCSRTEVQRLLGNAVPSLLAEVLAREIRRQFFGWTPRGKPKLLRPALVDVPPMERVQPVPEKFLHRVGDHSDHPGTGKGTGAQRRLTAEAGTGSESDRPVLS
jgi:DNA (cytosine-5)-methyltransferase 1